MKTIQPLWESDIFQYLTESEIVYTRTDIHVHIFTHIHVCVYPCKYRHMFIHTTYTHTHNIHIQTFASH